MELFSRILQLSDADEILDYENKKLAETIADEADRSISSWHAPWRREALEHYLSLGWSFIVRDPELDSPYSEEGRILGYFLCQPILFFQGQTQSLWIEHISFSSLKARDVLCEIAYKLGRDKHIQQVLFPSFGGIANSIQPFKPETWTPNVLKVKTTKS
ncbi:MAG: hypothetical protein N2578_00845 [Bdellovibrionaceae bacterium]|nr:hypothetical protein [Pseudobdellovibrionaceae bacterium]